MVLVLEHGWSRTGRWLRRHRLRFAFAIAVVEGALVLLGVVPAAAALLVAAALVALYVVAGRNVRSDSAHQLSWIGAVSQLLVAAIPLLVALVTVAAFVALALLVVAAVVVLVARRR